MLTPWFAGAYIYEAAKDEIDSMSYADAKEAYYPEPGEYIIHLS